MLLKKYFICKDLNNIKSIPLSYSLHCIASRCIYQTFSFSHRFGVLFFAVFPTIHWAGATPTGSVIWDTLVHVLGHAKRRMQVTWTSTTKANTKDVYEGDQKRTTNVQMPKGNNNICKYNDNKKDGNNRNNKECRQINSVWSECKAKYGECDECKECEESKPLPAAVVECPFAVTQLHLNISQCLRWKLSLNW